MGQSQPQITVTMPPPPIMAQLAALAMLLGMVSGVILLMLPAQERQTLALMLRQQRHRLYLGLSAKARRAGFEGMSSELEGRNPGAWYEMARGLAWWRDRVKPS